MFARMILLMDFGLTLAAFPGPENVQRFATNCLAVAGAFVAGYLLGAIGGWAVDKWLFAKRSPDAAKKAISVFCGILLALLVAFLVFGDGTGGGWFGGGTGSSGSQDTNTGTKTDPDSPKPVDPNVKPKIDVPPPPDLKSDDPKIRITFLGGDAVQGDRFYLIDDDPIPKSFAELKSIVQNKKDSAARTPTLVVLYPPDPRHRIDPNSINVTQVTSWAKSLGLGVYEPGKR